MTIQIELESLRKENDVPSVERRQKLEHELASKRDAQSELTTLWEKERSALASLKNAKQEIEDARLQLDQAQREGDYAKASELRYSTLPKLEAQLPKEGECITEPFHQIQHISGDAKHGPLGPVTLFGFS